MTDWRLFQGNGTTQKDGWLDENLPAPPPWRVFGSNDKPSFVVSEDMKQAVNAAFYLRRPLLLTGKPGTGKSSLIDAVAYELQLGKVLRWPITSKTTLKSGIYEYDALGRLNARESDDKSIGRFLTLGPLGTALQASDRTRALLIDEIDKGDLDLPNDLLHVFERGDFSIPELERWSEEKVTVRTEFARLSGMGTPLEPHEPAEVPIVQGKIRCSKFPFIVLTSNGEREFPAPFLRRCIRLEIKPVTKVEELRDMVLSHLKKLDETVVKEIDALADDFLKRRASGDLANDQLLNAVFLACDLKRQGKDLGADRADLLNRILAQLTNTGYTSGT
jgi:MoxR-like ATPase